MLYGFSGAALPPARDLVSAGVRPRLLKRPLQTALLWTLYEELKPRLTQFWVASRAAFGLTTHTSQRSAPRHSARLTARSSEAAGSRQATSETARGGAAELMPAGETAGGHGGSVLGGAPAAAPLLRIPPADRLHRSIINHRRRWRRLIRRRTA